MWELRRLATSGIRSLDMDRIPSRTVLTLLTVSLGISTAALGRCTISTPSSARQIPWMPCTSLQSATMMATQLFGDDLGDRGSCRGSFSEGWRRWRLLFFFVFVFILNGFAGESSVHDQDACVPNPSMGVVACAKTGQGSIV